MRMKKILYTIFYSLLLVSFGTLFTSCSDKDDPFAGDDSYIVEFALTQGSATYKADISNQTIVVKVPEGISLNGATTQVKLSENATIYPNPETITAWDEEMIFVVTSYNNKQTKYTYTIERTSVSSEGTILLETQAEVDAFGMQDITAIKGSLVIGRASGADSITNLDPLAKIKEISYSLTIHPTFSGSAINGFDALEHVGGSIYMKDAPHVERVVLPNLKSVGSIYLENKVLGNVSFRVLAKVAQSIIIKAPLAEMNFTNLKYMGEQLSISDRNAMLTVASFPLLEKATRIEILNLPSLAKIILPELKEVGDLFLSNLRVLSYLDASKLVKSTGAITFPDVSKLIEASFPMMEQADVLALGGKDLSVLEFPQLRIVHSLKIKDALISGISEGFPKLESIADELKFENLQNMKKLSIPSTVKEVGKLTLYVYGESAISEIDVRGMNIKELSVERDAVKGLKITGDKVFKGTLSVSGDNSKNSPIFFPELVGFEEVDSLYLGSYISRITDMQIKGIKKINKGFKIPNNNLKNLEMPDLEEVGGEFVINHLAQVETPIQTFPKLRKVGGSFRVETNSRAIHTLSFPELIAVGGDLTLGTGLAQSYGNADLSTVNFPKLTTIEGELTIKPKVDSDSKSYVNKRLRTLDGFSALKKVRAVSVVNQVALESYAGFAGIISLLSAQTWNAEGNGYNPTYDDLAAGKLVKP